MYTNDLRGTLQQSSMQQQLQQHPSGEAAAVLVRLTWVLSKSFSWGTWHKCISYAPRVDRQPLCDGVGGSAILSGAFIFFLVDTG